MEEREKRRKILYIILGIIVLILLFFMISSCSNKSENENQNAITNIDLAMNSITMTVDEEDALSYTILPTNTNETTRWISSDSSVVTVDTRGNIRALKPGSAIITLVSEGGVSDYVVVKVVSKRTESGVGVTANLIENDINVKVGSTKKLNYELYPSDSKYIEVMWESNNNLVATVSSDGVVTGVKSGVTSVSVKIVLSDNTVITDTATVTVEENASLYMTTTIPDIRVGEVIRLSAALSTNDVTITEGTVKSKKDSIASISNVSHDSNYLTFDVKGVKNGDTTLQLTVITSDGKTLNLDVPVTVVKFTDLYISSGNKELAIGNSFILSGRLEPSISGSLETECKSSNEKLVTVSNVNPSGEYNGACQITALKEGKATITMTISGVKQSIKVTVKENAENPNNPENPGNPSNPNDPENPGTPNDPENPGTPNNPENPGTPNNPGNPVNPGIGQASLSVTLDKTTYSINDKAVITVTFKDENGNTKTLSTGEYVVATEFDSSSLGTKKLVVVYPYGNESLKAEVEYTISGGSSGGSSSPGNGGYSSSGGSSGGGTTGSGVKKSTGSFEIVDCEGETCKGEIKVNYKVQGNDQYADNDEYLNTILVFECKVEGGCKDVPPPDAEALTESGNWTDKEASKYWDVINVVIGDNDTTFDVETTTDGRQIYTTALSVEKDVLEPIMKEHDLKVEDKLDIRNEDEYDAGLDVINASTQNGVGIEGSGEQLDKTIVDTNYIEGADSEAGTLTVKPVKLYKKSGASATFQVTASAKDGYKIINVKSDDLSINEKVDTRSFTRNGSTTKNLVYVTAEFENVETGKKFTKSASVTIQIDDIPPVFNNGACTVKGLTVTCTATDDLSGMESITSSVSGKKASDSGKTMTYIFNITKSGDYTFTAKDQAGNTASFSINVGGYACYLTAVCGEGKNAGTCKSCQSAGCQTGSKPHHEYKCTKVVSETYKPTKTVYKEASIKLYSNGKEWHEDYGYIYEAPQTFVDSDGYTCEPVSNNVQCGINRNVLGSEVFTPSSFATNCRVCGCDGWKKLTENYVYNSENLALQGTSDSTQITAYKIKYFSQPNCQGESGEPTFSIVPSKYTAIVKGLLGNN